MTNALPLQNVAIADKTGKVTVPWQRFFLALQNGNEAVQVVLGGTAYSVGSLDFGSGFYGNVSGHSVTLTSGMEIISGSSTLENVNTLALEGDFNISGTGESLTLSIPAGAVEVASNGIIINGAAELLNFSGNAQVTSLANGAQINVGGAVFYSHGTLLGAGNVVNAGTLLTATEPGFGTIDLDFSGMPALSGTTALGSFTAIDLVSGLGGTIVSGTLNLTASGASALVIENAGTSIGTAGTLNAASGVSFSLSGSIANLSATSSGLTVEDSHGSTIANPAALLFASGTLTGSPTLATYTPPNFTTGNNYYSSTAIAQSLAANTSTTLNNCTITFPASSVARVFATGFNVSYAGYVGGNVQFTLDGTSNFGIAGYQTINGGAFTTYNGNGLVTIPGDNATHTLNLTAFASGAGTSTVQSSSYPTTLFAVQVG